MGNNDRGPSCHVVLLETAGNQAFIFASNKLRENVGASQLTYEAGTLYVLDAVARITRREPPGGSPDELERWLLSSQNNPRLDDGSGPPVEVIVATSGKAVLLVRERTVGEEIVAAVTKRALTEAPGLEIHGAISEAFDWSSQAIWVTIAEVHRRYEVQRSRSVGVSGRFCRLPFVADCVTSGLPANRVPGATDRVAASERSRPLSAVSLAKSNASERWRGRLETILESREPSLPRTISELDELGCEWLGVIHADGNGLGQVFLRFHEQPGLLQQFDNQGIAGRNRVYVEALRRFSLALDRCCREAFSDALGTIATSRPHRERSSVPIVPMVLGGDDLTVVCDGQLALDFTAMFLEAFERHTRTDGHIAAVLGEGRGITACAGVAIVKPHFPFFSAYQLSEQLLKSAKKIGKDPRHGGGDRSAIDFHILYDASNPDLDRIRQALTMVRGGETACLTARPLLVGGSRRDGTIGNADDEPNFRGRCWEDLLRRAEAVHATDDEGRRVLPNSLLHELRVSAFHGKEAADARLRLVRHRYESGFNALLDANDSLWFKDPMEPEQWRTGLLDAMEVQGFLHHMRGRQRGDLSAATESASSPSLATGNVGE